MSRAPKTSKKASKLNRVLPPNKKEASTFIKYFWEDYLKGNQGTKHTDLASSPPSPPWDEHIEVKKAKDSRSGEEYRWLEWHGSVVFKLSPGRSLVVFMSTLDEPGAYRMDFVLNGQKKSDVQRIRERVNQEVWRQQDKMTLAIPDDEEIEFERLRVSAKRVPHSHKIGFRQDDNLIGRINLEDVPLYKLPARASELRSLTKKVGDIVLDELPPKIGKSKPSIASEFRTWAGVEL